MTAEGEQVPAAALRCSFAAELRGDPLAGTAAPASGFLLVEQPGPWGRLALVESRLDPAVGAAVGARAVAAGLRTLLIRRPEAGRDRRSARLRRWGIADCTPGSETLRWGSFDADTELLDLPLDGSIGVAGPEPCYLVCTHGRHDACCAIRGRPVAAALAVEHAEQVWECSHVGGDRFAANLVLLPHGLAYGRVDADAAREVVAAHAQGYVCPQWLRGRASFPPVAQAAQALARGELGEHAINALNPHSVETLSEGRWRVRLNRDPTDLLVTVLRTTSGPAALLTCAASHSAHAPGYRLERIDTMP